MIEINLSALFCGLMWALGFVALGLVVYCLIQLAIILKQVRLISNRIDWLFSASWLLDVFRGFRKQKSK